MMHILLHSLEETAKVLPFLFLTYLLMEFLEHKAGGAPERWLRHSGKVGPLMGGALGLLPQCGFSAAASGMYAGRIITTGTLLAVYLSTSDEMLPILLSSGASPWEILRLLGIKLLVGVAVGFFVDLVAWLLRRFGKREPEAPQIEELCEREHCRCGDHFVLSAFKHTVEIALFIFLVAFALNLLLHLVGEDRVAAVVNDLPVLGNLLAALIGLIPNCAPSVALTRLYLSGLLGIGPLMSGLLVNAGVGLVVLFRLNRPLKDSLRILGILFGAGLCAGLVIGWIF